MTILLLFMIFAGSLALDGSESSERNILKPSLGLLFQDVGSMIPTYDVFSVTLFLDIPKLSLPNISDIVSHKPTCPPISDVFDENSKQLCNDFLPIYDLYIKDSLRYRNMITEKHQELTDLLGNHEHSRQKRFIPLFALGSIVSMGLSLGNGFYTHKRISQLEKGFEQLSLNQANANRNYIELHKDLTLLSNISDHNMELLSSHLQTNSKEVRKLGFHVRKLYSMLNSTLDETVKLRIDLQMISSMQSHIMQGILTNIDSFRRIYNFLNDLVDSVHQVITGRLPVTLVSPSELTGILDRVSTLIYSVEPDYDLVFKDVNHYFKQSTTILAVSEGKLGINFPIYLQKRNQKSFDLFKIKTVHVPLNMSDNSPRKSYTKLNTDVDVFSVHDSVYFEMDSKDLPFCDKYENVFICPNPFLQTHRSRPSCLASIYFNNGIVREHCKFNYYHDIEPKPQILDGGKDVLLANVETPFNMICEQTTVPLITQGTPYCLIKRSSLCSCSLLSGSNFIDSHISGCNNSINDLNLKFVINGGAELILNSTFDYRKLNLDTLYSNVPVQYYENFEIVHDKNDILLEATSLPVDLRKLHGLFSRSKPVYFSSRDKAFADQYSNRINPWKVAMSLSAVLCCFCILIFCIAYCRQMVLFLRNHCIFQSQKQIEQSVPTDPIDENAFNEALAEMAF